MWAINLMAGIIVYLSLGFAVVLIGYRYRDWKGGCDEDELVMFGMLCWPIMVFVWMLSKFGKIIQSAGRLAGSAGRSCCKDD